MNRIFSFLIIFVFALFLNKASAIDFKNLQSNFSGSGLMSSLGGILSSGTLSLSFGPLSASCKLNSKKIKFPKDLFNFRCSNLGISDKADKLRDIFSKDLNLFGGLVKCGATSSSSDNIDNLATGLREACEAVNNTSSKVLDSVLGAVKSSLGGLGTQNKTPKSDYLKLNSPTLSKLVLQGDKLSHFAAEMMHAEKERGNPNWMDSAFYYFDNEDDANKVIKALKQIGNTDDREVGIDMNKAVEGKTANEAILDIRNSPEYEALATRALVKRAQMNTLKEISKLYDGRTSFISKAISRARVDDTPLKKMLGAAMQHARVASIALSRINEQKKLNETNRKNDAIQESAAHASAKYEGSEKEEEANGLIKQASETGI